MAIYQLPDGTWMNSDDTAYGSPGVPISAPSAYAPSGVPIPVESRTTLVAPTIRPASSITTSTQVAPTSGVVRTLGSTPVGNPAPSASGGDGGGSPAPSATAPRRPRTNPLTGEVQEMADEDYQNLLDRAAEQKRQQAEIETQKQFQLDTDRAAQVATAAYQQSMAAYNSQQLASAAADNAMRAEIERQRNASQVGQWGQQNMLQGQAQGQAAQYQGQQMALQQRSQLVDLRKRRPFRSARISMI